MKRTIKVFGLTALAVCALTSCMKQPPTTQPTPAAVRISNTPPPPPIVLARVRVTRLAGPKSLYPPNPRVTSGAIDPRVTQETIRTTICVPEYTEIVGLSIAFADPVKARLLANGHLPGTVQNYELDHLIPLNLGGSATSRRNWWLQPYGDATHLLTNTDKWPEDGSVQPGARQKNVVETLLNTDVCQGKMTLKEAQERIRTDWFALYKERVGSSPADK
jgi:hypothetical protein